ncbi:hypothetical protein FA15DRAFT_730242 [Coprinopsis marcescibilis]|uniref:Uncharacterized protein n=1 Tax=Coprinopsis marcescibilis TaxID=230819 RepID=A0A5C3KE95_COPMA|nr:hypothetical protein FA15DRAFT_730242 [Coprinopsis marcescibilis]
MGGRWWWVADTKGGQWRWAVDVMGSREGQRTRWVGSGGGQRMRWAVVMGGWWRRVVAKGGGDGRAVAMGSDEQAGMMGRQWAVGREGSSTKVGAGSGKREREGWCCDMKPTHQLYS